MRTGLSICGERSVSQLAASNNFQSKALLHEYLIPSETEDWFENT